MARHVIQIPIIKSSNGIDIYHNGTPGGAGWVTPPAISNVLLMSRMSYNSAWRVNNIGLAWDGSLIPKNKTIVSIKLHLYSRNSFLKTIIYGSHPFTEGSHLISTISSDGTLPGAFTSGWNILDISNIQGDSIIIGSNTGDNASWGEFNSHRNPSNKPFIEVTYDDIPPSNPSSLYPSNITLNPRDAIRFSWLHNSNEGLQQKAFSLQYSTNGGTSWTTVNQTTPNQYYDMPVNTLPTSGSIMWRVRTTDGNNDVTGYTTASFTLGTPPQKAPTPIKPIGEYLDSTKPTIFEWNFEGGTPGETQSKFDLQYSINSGSTWTTKTIITNETFYELPENTFNITGNILWRVRTHNNYNEVSPYSENRNFYVISSPPIPQITEVGNTARATIGWTSQGQYIYELEVLKDNKVIYSTGSIPSTTDRSHKITKYLQDGNYNVRIRVINEYSLYSPWAEKSFIISTVKPDKPTMDIYSGGYSVTIKTDNTSLKTFVYRDDKLIGEVIDNTLIDFTGENDKHYKYLVRTIDEDGGFNDSDIKLAKCKFGGNTLALGNSPGDFIKLKTGLNSNPKKSNQFGVAASLQNYDGRKYSVVEFSEFSNLSKTLSFYVKTKKEIDRIIEMIEKRETFLYRNRDGSNIYGTILSVDYDEDETFDGYEIGFTITRTEV